MVFLLALFCCVLLHEFGHAWAARLFGIQTPDITLLPIGGVARLRQIPERPLHEFIVAIAGPLVNVLIAGFLLMANGGFGGESAFNRLDDPAAGIIPKLIVVNLLLVVFNLIPAFPMDGGRVFRAILGIFMNFSRATTVAARAGQICAFIFGFIGLFANPLLIFIAVFIYLGAEQEASFAKM